MIAACFWSSRKQSGKPGSAGFRHSFCRWRDALLPLRSRRAKIAETSRVDLPAPSALHGIKIDTNESALDLKRTEALLATYPCPIADYLAEIAQKPMSPHGRFLIVSAKDRDENYVQCLFFDDDKQIRCEGGTRAIAKLIIELLARVYDLGTSDGLEYYAPLLSSKKGNPVIVDSGRCPVPTSSLPRKLVLSTILARHP